MGFSSGKDAVAMMLRVKPFFDEVVPYCAYYVPGLRIMDEALAYYEHELFGRKIIRAPHPWFVGALKRFMYQDPEGATQIARYQFPEPYTHQTIVDWIIEAEGLPEGQMLATGSRAGEFMYRGAAAAKSGGIQKPINQWWPIWEMNRADVLKIIADAGLKLSREYDLFNASIAGLDYSMVKPLQMREPEDWQTVKDWFPLIGAELWRFDRRRE